MNLKEMNLKNKTVTIDLDEFKKIMRLAEIGRATEKALDIDGMNAYIYDDFDFDITNVEDLLKWYKESEE